MHGCLKFQAFSSLFEILQQFLIKTKMIVYYSRCSFSMMVKCSLMMVKCYSMMVKWVNDHILNSPSFTSISPSLPSILPSLAWSKPSFAHLAIIEKLRRLYYPPPSAPTQRRNRHFIHPWEDDLIGSNNYLAIKDISRNNWFNDLINRIL